MQKYEFAALTAKSDMLMGLSYPAVFGILILAAQTGFFYSGFDKILKEHYLLTILIMFSILYTGRLLIKRIKKSLVKNYLVKLDGTDIKIWESGKEIMCGRVVFCRVKIEDTKISRSVTVEIHTDTDKISFRSRPEEYESVTGVVNCNPFGTGNRSDMETIFSLGERIKSVIEEQAAE